MRASLCSQWHYSAIVRIHLVSLMRPSCLSSLMIFFTALCGNSSSIAEIFIFPFFTSCFMVRQRTCLSDPSNFDCLDNGLIFVLRAVRSNAHWSMSALCQSRDLPLGITVCAKSSSAFGVIVSGSLKRKISTLLILVSITGTEIFHANAMMAAEV